MLPDQVQENIAADIAKPWIESGRRQVITLEVGERLLVIPYYTLPKGTALFYGGTVQTHTSRFRGS